MDDFLPKDYNVPSDAGNYMKFQDGDNRFRILSNPILGWEDWDDERKVYRYRMLDKPDKSKSAKKDARVKHFWAMVVWNYQAERVQVLSITQSSIQKVLKALAMDEDWGNPQEYDIVVNKTGEKLDTEYQVTPKPKKPVAKEVSDALKEKTITLEALYDGSDPFDVANSHAQDVDPDSVPVK